MKLRVNYVVEEDKTGRVRIAEIKNTRIRTRKDQERLEILLAKKLGYEKVRIFNWRIIGTISERLGGK